MGRWAASSPHVVGQDEHTPQERQNKAKREGKKKKKRRVLLESKDFPEFKGLRRGKGTQQPGEDAPVAPTAAGGGQGWGRAWVCVWWCVFV